MSEVFMKSLSVNKVRNMHNLEIFSELTIRKNIIITGKNGTGKTSLLDALGHLFKNLFEGEVSNVSDASILSDMENSIKRSGMDISFSEPLLKIREEVLSGNIVFAYYKADRYFEADVPKHIEKVFLQDHYAINGAPRKEFVKYLLDMKMTAALAISNNNKEKANEIQNWFTSFNDLLKVIFEDSSTKLVFDEDNFEFSIQQAGKEPFDFNTMSSGYEAIMDIIVDLIIRMGKKCGRKFIFHIPGIVLIDEIETHLHLELQKKVLRILSTIFPNIQFIVSTHSPFILNSLENAYIFDLEKRTKVANGLSNVPYEGIVTGYFNVDELSTVLRTKFEKYKELISKDTVTDDDFEEIAHLEIYLDEIPDYLALDISTEYQRLKLQFEGRDDM